MLKIKNDIFLLKFLLTIDGANNFIMEIKESKKFYDGS